MSKTDTPIGDAVSTQFRQVAGLPERKNDKPSDPLKPSELRRQVEPEGGYDGRGETEVDERHGKVDEDLVKELQDGEELSAKSGQGATDGTDASTSTEATEAQADAAGKGSKPAKKTTTAKKAAASGKGK
jgi:hypothetical protein